MNLIRRNHGISSFMDDFFDTTWSGLTNPTDTGTRVPAVNIKETDEQFEIEVAAPGMEEKDFNIDIQNNTLQISVTHEEQSQESSNEKVFTRKEFSFNSFKRVFSLPNTADQDQIDASYDKGILSVTIPKKEEARPKAPRRIEVKNASKKSNLIGEMSEN